MILHLYHGRLTHDGPATDTEGNEVDDWGFEGPKLHGVKSLIWTYGNLAILFIDHEAYKTAEAQTKWADGVFDNSLRLPTTPDTVRVFNTERTRYEYFGDWSLSE